MINSIRNQYESDKEDILKDKIKDTKKLEREYRSEMIQFAQSYDENPYIQIILKSGKTGYEAITRE